MMLPKLADHTLFQELKGLGLDPDEYVVCGSGLMLVRGLRDIGDLDVVARGSAWERAAEIGRPTVGELSGTVLFELGRGRILVSRTWFPPHFDTDLLIARAEVHEDVRFAAEEDVVAYKTYLKRDKDRTDLDLLAAAHTGGR